MAERRLRLKTYRQFVEYVTQQLSGGPRFLDDLPREVLADDTELDAIIEQPAGAVGKGDKR
jgi:hypothetical protein